MSFRCVRRLQCNLENRLINDFFSQDFEEAKRREIAMDAPKEVDTTLPGWVCHTFLSSFVFLIHLHRAHGVAPVHANPSPNHISSKSFPASTPNLAPMPINRISLSPKNETRKPRRSILCRICRSRIRARHSLIDGCSSRWDQSGIRELGSREGPCPRWSRRCVSPYMFVY